MISSDVFSIQDLLSRKIASALNVRVEAHERTNALTKPPTNLNAYDYYLRGRQLERSYDHQERARARGMFNAAIEADPLYARGYLGLAWFEIRALKWAETSEMEAILARALSAASRAMELDSNDPDCHWLMGLIHLWRRDHAKSISCYERARAMNPNQPDLLADMADMFTYAGRSEEAIELATLACELNPNPPDWYYWNIAAAHFLIGRYEDSLNHLQRMAQPGPAHRLFAANYAKPI
ncbi:tetratricopeptide repeat protein [Mesorhizobium mediterraneum]|uniref:tetratricopeptide repeat protein n=1 Tax=Mesorhizobium mediterraneum TaxID=43617 RepID=UPI001784FB61|nr:tetratricopeptide repeat protein [Mesorhizobium mediterraneum]